MCALSSLRANFFYNAFMNIDYTKDSDPKRRGSEYEKQHAIRFLVTRERTVPRDVDMMRIFRREISCRSHMSPRWRPTKVHDECCLNIRLFEFTISAITGSLRATLSLDSYSGDHTSRSWLLIRPRGTIIRETAAGSAPTHGRTEKGYAYDCQDDARPK